MCGVALLTLPASHVAQVKTEGGKIIRVEAHPIPEHPRPRRVKGRVGLVGDAAGYVTKCSGEGIYFAAKSGRMVGEAIVKYSEGGKKMVGEAALRDYLDKWDRKYWTTYKVLDILQKVFYRCGLLGAPPACSPGSALGGHLGVKETRTITGNRIPGRTRGGMSIHLSTLQLVLPRHAQCDNHDAPAYPRWDTLLRFDPTTRTSTHCARSPMRRSNPAREAFVELCEDNYVQKMTFDSYLYKTVVPGNPVDDIKLLVNTVGSLLRANALRSGKGAEVSFGSKTNEVRQRSCMCMTSPSHALVVETEYL
jgi:hypothetical protein